MARLSNPTILIVLVLHEVLDAVGVVPWDVLRWL